MTQLDDRQRPVCESTERLSTMPANYWVKCSMCGASIYHKRLVKNLHVCPECNHHFSLRAAERIALLLDCHSFQERDQHMIPGDPLEFTDTRSYPARIAEHTQKLSMQEAAIYGTGTIGKWPVVICALDFSFLGGSMGSVVGEKVTRAIELATATRTPLVICSASGGARMQEGALSLLQMAKTAAALAVLAEAGIPYFSLICDPTYGGVSASFASLGNIIIAEPHARIGFAGRSVIEQTIRQQLPTHFQTAEFLIGKGHIDLIVPRHELPATFTKLLAAHAHAATWKPPRQAAVTTDRARATQTPPRSAWEIVQLARHPNRPRLPEYIALIFEDFLELHGDRMFGDDPAIVGGIGRLHGRPVMIIGHRKGHSVRENVVHNFGMPHPEGYRKALRLMHYAAQFGFPLLTFIDTPGAYPGMQAEERNQSEAIARNLLVMARLPVPVICTIVGEGGSGGALALGVGDRVLMLANATYSVISPEGCAAILFKEAGSAARAAEALRLTAHDLHQLGVVDAVIAEPPDGAHTDPGAIAAELQAALIQHLAEVSAVSPQTRLCARYERFRSIGIFENEPVVTHADDLIGVYAQYE